MVDAADLPLFEAAGRPRVGLCGVNLCRAQALETGNGPSLLRNPIALPCATTEQHHPPTCDRSEAAELRATLLLHSIPFPSHFLLPLYSISTPCTSLLVLAVCSYLLQLFGGDCIDALLSKSVHELESDTAFAVCIAVWLPHSLRYLPFVPKVQVSVAGFDFANYCQGRPHPRLCMP